MLDEFDIRRTLRQGDQFPKDSRWADPRRENPFANRDRKQERTALHALTNRHARHRHRLLAQVIANCAPDHQCGHFLCYQCRTAYWRRRWQQIEPYTAGIRRDDGCLVTVVIAVVHADKAKPVVEVFKAAIDKANPKITKALGRAGAVKWLGWYEVDAHPLGALASKTFKKKTLRTLGYDLGSEKTTWVLHYHAVVLHPGWHRLQVKLRLLQAFWADPRVKKQVDVKRLHRGEVSTNIQNCLRYPLKFTPPEAWMPEPGAKGYRAQSTSGLRTYIGVIHGLGGLHSYFQFDGP